MILVFGGTTEGKKVAGILEQSGYQFCYSTKTETDFQPGNYRFGAFTKESLADFCEEKNIQVIINASHPFAEGLHQTIYEAVAVPVLRFERNYPERLQHPLIHYVPSYPAAIEYLNTHPVSNLLALTGVQTIEKLKPYWLKDSGVPRTTIFRILPRSVAIAAEAGFPVENLILEMPTDDLQHELSIIHQYHIDGIITKESGDSGFLFVKIAAAIHTGIPIIIITRPELPKTFFPVYDDEELLSQLNKILE